MGGGGALTVKAKVCRQPVGSVYVIVVAPLATPVTMPVSESTEAMEALLVVHVPPPVRSLNVVVSAIQTLLLPNIVVGIGFTVTVVVR